MFDNFPTGFSNVSHLETKILDSDTEEDTVVTCEAMDVLGVASCTIVQARSTSNSIPSSEDITEQTEGISLRQFVEVLISHRRFPIRDIGNRMRHGEGG